MLLTRQERYCGIRSSYLKILNAIVDAALFIFKAAFQLYLKQLFNK